MRQALRYGEGEGFLGVALDSGCVGKSVIGLAQARAYCKHYGVPMKIDQSIRRKVTYGSGPVLSLGAINLKIPFPAFGVEQDVEFLVVPSDIPALLSLDDLDSRDISLHTLERELVKVSLDGSRSKTQLHRHAIHRLLFHVWDRDDVSAFYTLSELQKLHRSLGHRSVEQLSKILKRARPEEFSSSTRHALEEIASRCRSCEKQASRPRRFKLTVGAEDLRFNHAILADIMYVEGRPVLHIIDEATHFTAAKFMKSSVSARETWRLLRSAWIHTYLGPPDHLKVDAGSQFTAEEFRRACAANGIEVQNVPVESPSSLSIAERYHAPLRASYLKLSQELPENDPEELLEMAVKATNDSVNPEGLCPTLLVFGDFPKLIRRHNTPAATELERARAIDKAMDEIQREYAKSRVQLGLRMTGPVGNESSALDDLRPGSPVRLFRTKTGVWEGPFPFISKDHETCIIQLPSGRKMFRSNVVRPYKDGHDTVPVTNEDINVLFSEAQEVQGTEYSVETHATQVVNARDFGSRFDQARQKEFRGLMDRNTFRVVKRSAAAGHRVYGMRYVDALKNFGEGTEYEKSRLVVQAYNDEAARHILTSAPTCQRVSQRLLLNLAAIFPSMEVFTRDISQAYTQAKTSLTRPIFVKPPPEAGLADDELLEVLRPLYGLPESGLHWFGTYQKHHIEKLSMQDTEYDPCLLFKSRPEGGLTGAVVLQVDDTLGVGTAEFMKQEDKESVAFVCQPRAILDKNELQFNGFHIQRKANTILMHQRDKLSKLDHARNEDEFVSVRASGAYISTCTRPDLAARFQLLTTEMPTASHYRALNKLVDDCHFLSSSESYGLTFRTLDVSSLQITVFSDAGFANAANYTSQLGAVILLTDGEKNANILHWFSNKAKRITRSVAAAELYAMVQALDIAYVLAHTLERILHRKIDICAFTDSRILFNSITRLNSTAEKRLLIDLYALRESYDRRELSSITWVASEDNVADALTKSSCAGTALQRIMNTGKLEARVQGYVQR
jgi:transposase InsO family protein